MIISVSATKEAKGVLSVWKCVLDIITVWMLAVAGHPAWIRARVLCWEGTELLLGMMRIAAPTTWNCAVAWQEAQQIGVYKEKYHPFMSEHLPTARLGTRCHCPSRGWGQVDLLGSRWLHGKEWQLPARFRGHRVEQPLHLESDSASNSQLAILPLKGSIKLPVSEVLCWLCCRNKQGVLAVSKLPAGFDAHLL